MDISKFIDLVCRSQERYNQWVDVYSELVYVHKVGPTVESLKYTLRGFHSRVHEVFAPCFKKYLFVRIARHDFIMLTFDLVQKLLLPPDFHILCTQ